MHIQFHTTGRSVTVPFSAPELRWPLNEVARIAGGSRHAAERRLIEAAEVADYAVGLCADGVTWLREPTKRAVRFLAQRQLWTWGGIWTVAAFLLCY